MKDDYSDINMARNTNVFSLDKFQDIWWIILQTFGMMLKRVYKTIYHCIFPQDNGEQS